MSTDSSPRKATPLPEQRTSSPGFTDLEKQAIHIGTAALIASDHPCSEMIEQVVAALFKAGMLVHRRELADLRDDAKWYRELADALVATMADGDAWDGDDAEITILLCYVKHLGSPTVWRAAHDSIPIALYRSRETAERHCEDLMENDTLGVGRRPILAWAPDSDDEDSPQSLIVYTDDDPEGIATGYAITPLELRDTYDPEAEG